MRKAVVFALVFGLKSFGAPVGLFAQAAQQGLIAGEALDAGGRPLANIPVELLQAVAGQPVGSAVQTTTTDSRAEQQQARSPLIFLDNRPARPGTRARGVSLPR